MSTPIERLRNEHRHCSCWGENCSVKRHPNEDWDSHCEQCSVTWPCDLIAALDALEAETEWLRAGAAKALDAQRAEIDALQARLDAATELIRQGWLSLHRYHAMTEEAWLTTLQTCENCLPYREWLEGEGQ